MLVFRLSWVVFEEGGKAFAALGNRSSIWRKASGSLAPGSLCREISIASDAAEADASRVGMIAYNSSSFMAEADLSFRSLLTASADPLHKCAAVSAALALVPSGSSLCQLSESPVRPKTSPSGVRRTMPKLEIWASARRLTDLESHAVPLPSESSVLRTFSLPFTVSDSTSWNDHAPAEDRVTTRYCPAWTPRAAQPATPSSNRIRAISFFMWISCFSKREKAPLNWIMRHRFFFGEWENLRERIDFMGAVPAISLAEMLASTRMLTHGGSGPAVRKHGYDRDGLLACRGDMRSTRAARD